MSKVGFELPILFSDNKRRKGRDARNALQEAGIPFSYPPSDKPTPMLIVGLKSYTGIRKIKAFAKSERAQKIKERYKHEI